MNGGREIYIGIVEARCDKPEEPTAYKLDKGQQDEITIR